MKKAWLVLFLSLSLAGSAFAQKSGHFDLSLSGGAAFSKQSQGSGVTLDPTNNVNIVASLRIKFARNSGLEFNYGRLKNSQLYTVPGLHFRIQSTVTEWTGAYVFRPAPRGKFAPFLFAGAGALVFNPDDTQVEGVEASIGADRQYKPAFLYGGGVDYRLYWRFALRAQYRGLFFSSPDFKVSTLFTGARGHMAEPSVGLVFNF